MKKIVLSLAILFALAACKSGRIKSGKDLAKEVCNCFEKANGLPGMDRDREGAQKDCMTLQMDNWKDVQNRQKDADDYNAIIGQCGQAMIDKSFN